MRIESSERYDSRFSRRKFLALLGIGGTWLGLKIYYDAIPRFFPSAPEAEDVDSKIVFPGVWAVSKGINIRTSPNIPNKTRFAKPDNRISWDEIETVNGTSLEGHSNFVILNPTVVDGQYTWEGDPYWMRLMIKRKSEMFSQPYYLSLSPNTREFVTFLGFAGYGSSGKEYEDLYNHVVENNLPTNGRTILSQNSETMARDIMPGLWNEKMREKFEGQLDAEEKMETNLKIAVEKLVNVRTYPSLEYGNGEPVNIIGTVAEGTLLGQAIIPPNDGYHYSFAAVRSEDIRGPLFDGKGNPFLPPAGKILAISVAYLQRG